MSRALFPQFRRLPFELRSKIWSRALPHRLITVAPEFSYPSCRWKVNVRGDQITLLQVSRESRIETLRHYTILDCQTVSKPFESLETPNPIRSIFYIDFTRDTVLLEHTHEMPTFELATDFLESYLDKIQILAIEFEYVAFDLRSFVKLRSRFPNLRELIFVDAATETHTGFQQKTQTILKLLGPNHRHLDFPHFGFPFLFQDLTEPCDSMYEDHMRGTAVTSHLEEKFGYKLQLAESTVVPCTRVYLREFVNIGYW